MWHFPPSGILVPVDFGDASGRAVQVASAVAAAVGAQLQLVHAEVLEVPAYFTHDQLHALERERRVARARAQEFLEGFARQHGASRFTSRVEEGAPSAVVLEAARHADLVVMGTHGRRGPARWWLGSVAERVVHASPAPVLVVRADAAGVPVESVFAHPMLVSTTAADEALSRRIAAGLASAFDGRLADAAATCQADLARDRQATMVVLPASSRHGSLLAHPAEHWLRHCALPMLFVPDPVSKSGPAESLDQVQ